MAFGVQYQLPSGLDSKSEDESACKTIQRNGEGDHHTGLCIERMDSHGAANNARSCAYARHASAWHAQFKGTHAPQGRLGVSLLQES